MEKDNVNEINKDLLPYIFGQDESGYYHAEIPSSKLPYYFKRDMQLKRYTTVLVSVSNVSPYTFEEEPHIKEDLVPFDIFIRDIQDDWGDGSINFKITVRGDTGRTIEWTATVDFTEFRSSTSLASG